MAQLGVAQLGVQFFGLQFSGYSFRVAVFGLQSSGCSWGCSFLGYSFRVAVFGLQFSGYILRGQLGCVGLHLHDRGIRPHPRGSLGDRPKILSADLRVHPSFSYFFFIQIRLHIRSSFSYIISWKLHEWYNLMEAR